MATGAGTTGRDVASLIDVASRGRQRDGTIGPGSGQINTGASGDGIGRRQGHGPHTTHIHIDQNVFARALGIQGDLALARNGADIGRAGRCSALHQQMRGASVHGTCASEHCDTATLGRQADVTTANAGLRQAHHFHVTRDLRVRQALPGAGNIDAQHNIVVTPVLNVNVFGLDRIQTDSGLCTHHQLQAADGFTELCVFAAGVGLNHSAYG